MAQNGSIKKRVIPSIGVGLVLSFVLFSCTTPAIVSNQNLSYVYNKEQTFLHPEFVIFNKNDSISALYTRISSKELLFSQSGDFFLSTARIMVNFRFQADFDQSAVIDSGSVSLLMSDSLHPEFFYVYLEIKAKKGTKGLLCVKFSDLNRNQFVQNFLPLDRSKRFNFNDIMLVKPGDSLPVFAYSPSKEEALQIKCNYPEGQGFYVEQYAQEFPMPAPPFAIVEGGAFDLKPDSVFFMPFERAANFTLPAKGLYWVRRKPEDDGGFTIKRFYDHYPAVKDPTAMMAPLRFLTSKQEFKEISESPTRRAAVENFWIESSGNQDKARELIKVFYNRVKEANSYYTSYLEGWKSDRGLIFLVFGPPTIVYRNSQNEQWIYGAENSLMSLSFTFLKMDNPFTENDYSLIRNATYKNQWYQAVDSWRQGRVWLDN